LAPITAIILTRNEQRHLSRCIDSLKPCVSKIYVIDSGSTDKTVDIARAAGAQVFENPWVNHAVQFNWALEHCPIDTPWVLRLDADEVVTPELAAEINRRVPALPEQTTGVSFKRRVHFMGRWIRYGGYYPTILLRLFRAGAGRSEQRWMDEHITLGRGSSIVFDHDIIDENLNNLTWWTDKHNHYATREAIDLLCIRHHLQFDTAPFVSSAQARRKRHIKERLYARAPIMLRPVVYFLYRYFLRLGFLDGLPGLIFHTLQGFWYRFLVDAKIYELQRRAKQDGLDIPTLLKRDYNINPHPTEKSS
jgi:glycosyltransferase involved in cell wall biosynthesis